MKQEVDKNLKSLAFSGIKTLFLRHLVGFIINFAGGVFLARILGPEIIGLYFISFTLLTLFRGIIEFGIRIHFIRVPCEPSQEEIKVAFTFQQGLGLLSLVFVVALVAPLAVYWYGYKELLPLVASAGISAYFYSWQNIPTTLLERKLSYAKVGIIEVSEILVFNLVSVAGAFAGVGILGLSIGNILRGLVPAILAKTITSFKPTILVNKKAFAGLIKAVSPILGSSIVIWIIMLAPPVLIGSISGAKALGIAQLAYTVLGNTVVISAIIQRVGLSALSRVQEDKERFNNAVNKTFQILALFYTPLIMGISSFSPLWVPLVYGNEWKEMSNIMLIAAIPMVIIAPFSILASALFAKGLAKIIFKQTIIYMIIYWSVMAILAKSLGALSVPIAHLLAMLSKYILIYGYKKYCGKIDYKKVIFYFLIGIAIMFISYFTVEKGNILIPSILWGLFLLMIVFPIAKHFINLSICGKQI